MKSSEYFYCLQQIHLPVTLSKHRGSLTMFFSSSSSKGTITERAMLITPKECEACTNSPSPTRLALSLSLPHPLLSFPPTPSSATLSASLPLNLLLRLLPGGTAHTQALKNSFLLKKRKKLKSFSYDVVPEDLSQSWKGYWTRKINVVKFVMMLYLI